MKLGTIRKSKTFIVTKVNGSNRDFTLPAEMGPPDEVDPIGLEEGPDDDMHFTMRRIFSKNDVSPVSSDSFPIRLGSMSPNLPLVLYHNPG